MKEKDNKGFWNKFSGIYDFFMKKDEKMYEELVELIKIELNKEMNMLELATGTGSIGLKLAHYVRMLEATDFSEEMIELAKQKGKKITNIHFSVQDACHLPYKAQSFDVVLIANALHIMPEPKKALENIRRVMKEDGILIAPNFLWDTDNKWLLLKKKLMELVGFKAFNNWSMQSYIEFIESNGYQVIKHECLPSDFPLGYVVAKKA